MKSEKMSAAQKYGSIAVYNDILRNSYFSPTSVCLQKYIFIWND